MRSSLLILGIFWCALHGKFSLEALMLGILICSCVYCLNRFDYISK